MIENFKTPYTKLRNKLFRLTFENAAVGMAHSDYNGQFLLVNSKLCEITGYSREELLQKSFHEITHPDDLASELKQIEALQRQSIDSYTMEKRYIRKDGTTVWSKITRSAIFDEHESFLIYVGIVEDISEKKKAEIALERKQKKLAQILNSITECYIAVDRNWRLLEVNKAAERELFQQPVERLTGKVLWDFYPNSRGGIFYREYESAFRKNIPVHFEARLDEVDNWLEVHAYPGENILEIFFHDITRRKKLEEALHKSLQHYKVASSAAKIGAFYRNYQTGENYWSPELLKIYGLKHDDPFPLQDGIPASVHPDDRNDVLKLVQQHYDPSQDEEFNSDHRIILPDDSIRWMNVRGITEFDADKNPYKTYGIAMDITDQKQVEMELRDRENLFQKAFQIDTVGIIFLDLIGNFLHVNDAFLRMAGYDRRALEQKKLTSGTVTAEKWMPRTWQALTELKETGLMSPYEKEMIRPDGTRWWGLFAGTRLNEKEAVKFVIDITERKITEEALQKSEEKYRTLFNSIDEGFCICEMLLDEKGNPFDYRWLEVNPMWEKQTGLKAPLGRTVLELVPNLEQQWIDIYGKVALTGEPVRFQQESKAMGRWFDVYAFRVNEPHLLQFGLLFSDITSRKQAEKALQQKIEENEKLIHVVPAAIWIANDPLCTDIRGNEMANQLIASEMKENVAASQTSKYGFFRNGHKLFPGELPIEKAATENSPVLNQEIDVLLSDGKMVNLLGSAVPLNDEKGNVRGAIGAFIDVTQRVASEKALKESEEKFRALANNMSQLAWMMDNKGIIFWYNKRWYDYTGTTPEEMKDSDWQRIHHPQHLKAVVETINHSLETGKRWEEVVLLKNKKGKYRWFLCRAVPLKDNQGNIIRWLGTNTDINHQLEIENQLRNDSKLFEDLLYIAAHDLKGPIANLHTALDLMDSVSLEKKIMFLNQFRSLTNQLNDTTRGITDILQMQSHDKSAASDIVIEDLLDRILSEFENQLSRVSVLRNIQKPVVCYIEVFLYSILQNLISNAIKYCSEQVPLTIEITAQHKRDYTLLSVSDNGIGIDLNRYGDKLFSPFHRINTKKIKGTGIGLYLIKNIIEKNGGFIKVESTPGEGTTFHCYLKEYFK